MKYSTSFLTSLLFWNDYLFLEKVKRIKIVEKENGDILIFKKLSAVVIKTHANNDAVCVKIKNHIIGKNYYAMFAHNTNFLLCWHKIM